MRSVTEEQANDLLKLVRYKVWAFTRDQRSQDEDLVQEVVTRVLELLPKYDASRASLQTYQDRLIDRACANYLRRERAAKRGRRHGSRSINHPTRNGAMLHDMVDAEQQQRALGRRNRSQADLRDLALDLEAASASLGVDQRRLCEQIKQKSVAEVAEDEKVVRGTIYRRMRPVREAFDSFGLAEYLD
jgi:RNA polymerase sigma factor (sigma-70 family)